MTLEVIAIALTLVVHFIGAMILVLRAVMGDEQVDWRGLLRPGDDDGGGGGGPGFEPPHGAVTVAAVAACWPRRWPMPRPRPSAFASPAGSPMRIGGPHAARPTHRERPPAREPAAAV